jgi:hypothetical protein
LFGNPAARSGTAGNLFHIVMLMSFMDVFNRMTG